MNKRIAVIAGTPVDTQMGVDFLNKKDKSIDTIYLPLEDNPRACHIFQMKSDEEKYRQMKDHFNKGLSMGADGFFIYCNSLSAAFDFKGLANDMNVICITPLDAYEKIALDYECCGLIAANNQATAGIEKTLTKANPNCYVLGSGLLFLVEEIEKGFRNEGPDYTPDSIVKRHSIKKLCEFFKENGAQCLILGCTHFPFIHKALEAVTDLKIIDPADIMYQLISDAYRF